MKKVFSVILILVSLLSFRLNTALAAGIITYQGGHFVLGKGISFVFKGSGFRNKDLRNANIFVGSNYHRLACNVNKDDGRIVCVARGALTEYGGETGIIYLGGQVFYVKMPGRDPLRCGGLDVLGAEVEFEDVDGSFYVEFIPGQNWEAVEAAAASSVAENEFAGYRIYSSLYCTEIIDEPVEEEPEEEEPEEEDPVEEEPGGEEEV